MLNILLFIHIVISLLLIVVILLQRTGADGLSGISGNNMGIVTGRAAANFLTKTTVVLATLFILNSIVLANLSSKKGAKNIINKIDNIQTKEADNPLPIAK